jgi:hypothetical protein
MLAAFLLGLFAFGCWRRRRAFQRRMDAIDCFMEWGKYEKINHSKRSGTTPS